MAATLSGMLASAEETRSRMSTRQVILVGGKGTDMSIQRNVSVFRLVRASLDTFPRGVRHGTQPDAKTPFVRSTALRKE